MDMLYIVLGAIIAFVGAVFLLDGLFKTNKVIKNRTWSVLIGLVLILVGVFGTGFGAEFMEWTDVGTGTGQFASDSVCASFDLTPSVAASLATLNSDETKFTVAARGNQTAHTITESDNTTWVNPQLSFVVKPIVPAGSDADDLATIFYEVTNPEVTTTDGTDTYKLFTKSSGNRQLIWSGDTTEYVDGQSTMLMTENLTLTLTLTCSQDSYSRMENTYDPVTVYVKFSNGCGWSQTYQVDFMLIEAWT